MAEISVGEAVGEGFELIRRKPLVVMSWGLLHIGLIVLAFALMGPLYMSAFGDAMRQASAGGAAAPNVQAIMQAQSLSYLVNFASLAISAITSCAVFRAVLRPDQDRFAYLRLGPAELYLGFLYIAGMIALGIGLVIAMIPVAIVVFILIGAHAGAAAAIFGVLVGFAALAALIYLALRVSLVGPMMVDEGQFRLTEAWALTRGKVSGLLAIALLLVVILIAGELVIGLLIAALGFGALAAIAGGLQNLPALFQQPPQVVFGKLVPLAAILGLLWIPIAGCAAAVMGAPWARVYRDLRPRRDIAETFA
jgi:hypothetical protein